MDSFAETFVPSPAQRIAWDWLHEHDEALLLMGAGLGKTATVLHELNRRFREVDIHGALIVAPIRVCNLTWPAEVKRWRDISWMRVANLRTEEGWDDLWAQRAQLYLCNYEMLPKLREQYIDRCKGTWAFDAVVWDETTKAKNHSSKRINCIRKQLRKQVHVHWGLTGTPTPNSLMELFAQMRLIDGGATLGTAITSFRDRYFSPTDWNRYNWVPKANARENIYKRAASVAVVLRREDYLDIPDIYVEDVEVVMAQQLRGKLYDELEREMFLQLDNDKEIVANSAAVLVNKLLQITSGAIYAGETGQYEVLHDGKMAAMRSLDKRIGNAPTIVCYQYRHELDRLRAAMPGAVAMEDYKSSKAQEALIDQWNLGLVQRLLCHPRSMAHGLNMQEGGSTVVFYTTPWSPEDYEQVICRVARRGQDAVTTVYRLVTTDTIEDAVLESLRRKSGEQGALLSALNQLRELRAGQSVRKTKKV